MEVVPTVFLSRFFRADPFAVQTFRFSMPNFTNPKRPSSLR
jgi:hypothetical protein